MGKRKRAYAMKQFSKAAAILTTAMLAPCAALPVFAANPTMLGDVDLDQELSISDVILLARIAGEDTSVSASATARANADANQDGMCSGSDVVAVLRAIARIEALPEITPPMPERDPAYIHLNGNSITFEGECVEVSGNTATITASGTYYLDGNLTNGQVIVHVPDETADPETVKLFLNGVTMTNSNAPVIFVENAENTSINLVEGTENTLSDGTDAPAAAEAAHAVLHAKDDMTIKGEGSLSIHAGTQYGIHCGNDLKLNGGTVKITTLNEDALRGKTSVTIKDGTLEIDTEGDGVKSTQGNVEMIGGTVTVKSAKDAVQAETTLAVSGGKLLAYGDRGLTALGTVDLTGGSVLATATDNPCETLSAASNTLSLSFVKEWKKNNPITLTDAGGNICFEENTHKKYRYAIVSDASLSGSVNVYAGGIEVLHNGGSDFSLGNSYENVNNTANAKLLYAPLFDQSRVHKIEIDMPNWNDMIANATKEEYYPATVTIDGERFENVGVRTKGNSSLSFVDQAGDDKFSFRIQLNEYDKLQNYHGLTEFCINNMFSDPSCMRDILCYNALDALGGYGPKTTWSDLYVNGSLYSFYFMAEQPGKTLAERYATSDDAVFYKASANDCTMENSMNPENFEVQFGEDAGCQNIAALRDAINRFDPNNPSQIESLMDVSSFLKGFAVNAVMCNYDSYNGMIAHNYYLHYNNGKFYYVGWDYNLSLGNFMDYGASVNSDILTGLYNATEQSRPMISNLLKNKAYQDEYIGYVREIVSMYQNPEAVVNGFADIIRSHVQADPRFFFTSEQFETNIAKSATGLQVSGGNTGGWGGGWGGGFGGGMWGGFGGMWGGGEGGVFSFGGENISIVDFMIKRNEVISQSLGGR